MPTWSGVQQQIRLQSTEGVPDAYDIVRRGYLRQLAEHSGRNVVLYASCFTQKPGIAPDLQTITDEDTQGFMEVLEGLDRQKGLDLILHSPGGSPEAAEGIADYIHGDFEDRPFRVIIPQMAMSAATMIACAANAVVMGMHSSLGPIDPQLIITSGGRRQTIPAQAIVDEFSRGIEEMSGVNNKQGWSVLLGKYPPGFVERCRNHIEMSRILVKEWLLRRMLDQTKNKEAVADKIVRYLGDYGNFKSHGRHISRKIAHGKGIVTEVLEDDPVYQDLALSTFHAATATFSATGTVKIIENHNGKAFIKLHAPAADQA